MNLSMLVAVVTLIAGSIFFVARAHAEKQDTMRKANPAIYQELRNQALHGTRIAFGLPQTKDPKEPWGVLMDVSFTDGGSYTVTAMIDGSASIYLSSGGGSIGGVSHQAIRNAAQQMVKIASSFLPTMTPTKKYPLPSPGKVSFYVLTDTGVFATTAAETELGEQQNSLYPLFYAAQDIITEYRRIEQNK
jgi:hypothetical protein